MHFGAVVWAVLIFGALAGTAGAADTPPVLKQTATVEYWADGTVGHEHPGLNGTKEGIVAAAKKSPKQFKVNKRLFQDLVRFIDVQGSASDRLQRPDLVMINETDHPLSSDSFEFTKPCLDPNLLKCIKIKNFPFAFGIHMVENADTSITPHAFIYVPVRSKYATPKALGDMFWLAILHIPDDNRDCEYPTNPAEKEHCRVLRDLSAIWFAGERDYAKLQGDVRDRYRKYLDAIFTGYCVPNPDIPSDPTNPPCKKPLLAAEMPNGIKIEIDAIIHLLFGMRNHNEIIHGSLK